MVLPSSQTARQVGATSFRGRNMALIKTFAAVPALAATLSIAVTPAFAAELPGVSTAKVHAGTEAHAGPIEGQTAEHGRRYDRHHRYRYHRRGPGLGDVLTGVLIVGAMAKIARHATSDDRRRYPDRDREDRRDARWDDESGLDRAVEICVDAVERRERVQSVERADRTAQGWTVEGRVARGASFRCEIENDGRGVEVDIRSGDAGYRGDDDGRYEDVRYNERSAEDWRERDEDDGQWEDERYASEWSRVDTAPSAPPSSQAAPAYPGGPLGDEAEIDGDLEIGTGYKGRNAGG